MRSHSQAAAHDGPLARTQGVGASICHRWWHSRQRDSGELGALQPCGLTGAWGRRLTAAAFACSIPVSLAGQAGESEPADARSTAPQSPTIAAHPLSDPIQIDGQLDEEVWSTAPSFTGFVQAEPVEGARADNDSKVWVLYDDDALYIGARLYDERPEGIARGLTRRDVEYAGQYDHFTVMLDPDLDRRTGYEFQVSAANQQLDRYLHNDSDADLAWDAVWESAVQVDALGWTVEMRIPLSQIRYDAMQGEQRWGINFLRRRAADNELTYFSLESRLATGTVSQFGVLEGIRATTVGSRTELRPYTLASARAAPRTPGDPFSSSQDFSAQTGFDLRYGLGSSFTLDATVNPDFGQVEADPAVINLTAVETFFQERRPFFVEDARIFDFALAGPPNHRAFYSRRIGRVPQRRSVPGADFHEVSEAAQILGAAKVTGRTSSGFSMGAMTALTSREQGRAYFQEEDRIERFVAEPQTLFGVVRVRQDLRGGESTIGAIATGVRRSLPSSGEMDFLPSEAFVGGVDFEHTWADREWMVWGFMAGTHVEGDSTAISRVQRSSTNYLQRPDLEWGTFDPGATSLSGFEWQAEVNRRRGRIQGSLRFRQVLPGVEANDLGFTNISERIGSVLQLWYQEVRPTNWYRNYRINFFSSRSLSHELFAESITGDRMNWAQIEWDTRLGGDITFANFWRLSSQANYYRESMSRTETRGGPRMLQPARFHWSVSLSTDDRQSVSLHPSFRTATGAEDFLDELEVGLGIRAHPSPRLELQVEPSFLKSSLGSQYVTSVPEAVAPHPETFGQRYLFAHLERRDFAVEGRINWILAPSLSLEFFAQPLISSGDYVTYRQLLRSESYEFEDFSEGEFRRINGEFRCEGGRTCVEPEGVRWIDLDGSGEVDFSFQDRDFNIRSLRSTALLRWEYRPGSTVYLVWQRRQEERLWQGDFDLGRDGRALLGLPSDDVFIVKASVLLAL